MHPMCETCEFYGDDEAYDEVCLFCAFNQEDEVEAVSSGDGDGDDPNSIDLNSVMSFELEEYGELTDHDFELVADVYDNQNEDR